MTTTYIIIGILFFCIMLLKWASLKDAPSTENPFGDISKITSIFNKGFCLTGGMQAISRDLSYRNAIVVGGSGSGKSSCVLVNTIFSLARGNNSIAVLDPSGQVYQLVSGYLAHTYKIYCIDFSSYSDCFNPLAPCNAKTKSEVQQVVQIILKNSGTESKNDPYWSSSAEMLMQCFLQYLVFYAAPEYRNISNLIRIIQTFSASPQVIDKLIVRTKNQELITTYKQMNAVGGKTLQSTISSALVALKVFMTEEIARCSAANTIDFASFRKEKSILFICTPITKIDFYAPYSALVFEALFKETMSRIPNKKECSIFCLIDEMITMRFNNLGLVYSNIRKFNGGVMGLIQSEEMMEINYSKAEANAILSNSYAKVYLRGQNHTACKKLQEIIGYQNNQPVMNAAAIRTSNKGIILCGSDKPYLENMIPYYDHFILRNRTKRTPYQLSNRAPLCDPPLISLA